jgi:3-oxoacyl-(acyl-carrier-protein) synthase
MSATPLVITGIAAVSSAGVGIAALEEAVRSGRRCLRPVPEEILGQSGHEWAPAAAFRVADFMPPLKARKFDRCSQFAIAAAGMALSDAGIDRTDLDPLRVGIVLGCGFGGIRNSEEFLQGYFTGGINGLAPMLFPNTVPNAAASNVSIEVGFKGPNVTTIQRFCSAESALFIARRFLDEGRADVMLAGGVDEITPWTLSAFRALGQMRPDGSGHGFTEGAGILVLEREEHARKRKARIRARLKGINTIGLLLPGLEQDGLSRLVGGFAVPSLVSYSGVATDREELRTLFPAVPSLDTGVLLGRSLAMGGIAMAAHLLILSPGTAGIHLATSPEGPWFAVGFQGMDPGRD